MKQKNMERDLLQKELAGNETELAQLRHQQQRLENRLRYYENAERKKRTHRLCTIAGTLESIAPGIKELTLPEAIELLEIIFSNPDIKRMVHNWVQLHRQKYGEVESGGTVPFECDPLSAAKVSRQSPLQPTGREKNSTANITVKSLTTQTKAA